MIRFPAEWEPQSAVLIAWPRLDGDFSNRLEAVESTYLKIAEAISAKQKLLVVCANDLHREQIKKILPDNPNIIYVLAETDDIWVRDTAFLTIEKDNKPVLLNFKFNGWGNKYPHQKDDALNHVIFPQLMLDDVRHEVVDFVLEGGSVESDGMGTILTTRQCLLNPNRNQGLGIQDIEQRLMQYLGAKRVLWLDQNNLAGDDTDAHIDTLARFCSASTIAYTSCEDKVDPHYDGLKQMEAHLQKLADYQGKPFKLVSLPMPSPIYDEEDNRLPANYANFLIINRAVLVPVYDDPADKVALSRLAGCFPGHEMIPIPCRQLVHQYGSLHCMTMQFPVNVLT